ncbi:unnamed protein product [Parascedosporium putredinis]|uniref:Major facilitator superfamily (MFS) profile domain-containing protein n=1 Tax=Parascedosporium putredinis TaxID=1442378 RepID=A0A9P1MAX2_9PEZI|nr:unnamed protein product [Parascedosporium putredinis]CAI7993542.1 unnamed protein product [Parascedosporium putredinis]
MGFFKRTEKEKEDATISPELRAVLPQHSGSWWTVRHLLLLNLMLLVPSLSSATIGFDGAMMNGLQTVEQWRGYFNHPKPSILGVMNAIYPIGKIVGIFPAAWLSDKYGRKSSMWIGFVLLVLGAGVQGGSINTAMFICSRCLLGAATAFIAQPAPILVTELAYPTHRGKISALYQTFFYFGAIFAAWSTYGTFRLPSTWSWRIPSILQGAIPFIQFAFFWLVPESPRWLIAHGRNAEARAIFVKYHAGGDENSALVNYEMKQIEENLKAESEALSETSYFDLVRTPANRKRTLIAAIVGFFAQWNGAGVVSYYITLVLNTIGITKTRDQALINGLLQVFNWLAAVLAGALMVDRIGRRKLFLISTAGMCMAYVIWTALTSHFTRTLDQHAGHAVIFQFTLRARGVSVTYGTTFIGLIIGQFVNPIAMSKLGWKYYIVFCCILFVLFFVIYFLFPETKGRTLEEIAEIFEGPSASRRVDEEKLGDDNVDDEKRVSRDSSSHAEVAEVAEEKRA